MAQTRPNGYNRPPESKGMEEHDNLPAAISTPADKTPRYDMPTMSAQLRAPFDVRSPSMIQYMISEDRLDTFEGGAESLDFTFFGAFFAAALTLGGLAVAMYVSNQIGRIFEVCVALTPITLVVSVYFFVNGLRIRRRLKNAISRIKTESKTVLEMVAKPIED